ncbi:hypothetical protein [Azospirillum sp. SYSU D00513]|uniref:hypothetical protein n=1 Tax=Azospirillum sp. SYSU D00513 TaxID=2812561 RepID=UPI001A977024|nr:hypothetical protein [Azospirillum sp. SYSU D00513]
MKLTAEQKRWIMTADPDTGDLDPAPDWLTAECRALGLVSWWPQMEVWRLTQAGWDEWEDLQWICS